MVAEKDRRQCYKDETNKRSRESDASMCGLPAWHAWTHSRKIVCQYVYTRQYKVAIGLATIVRVASRLLSVAMAYGGRERSEEHGPLQYMQVRK